MVKVVGCRAILPYLLDVVNNTSMVDDFKW